MSISLGKLSNPIKLEISQAVSANQLCSSCTNVIAFVIFFFLFEGAKQSFFLKVVKCTKLLLEENETCAHIDYGSSCVIHYLFKKVIRKNIGIYIYMKQCPKVDLFQVII